MMRFQVKSSAPCSSSSSSASSPLSGAIHQRRQRSLRQKRVPTTATTRSRGRVNGRSTHVTSSANPNSGAKVGALTTVTNGDVKETSPFLKFVKRSEPGEKPRLVILGTGWAAARVARDLDVSKYDLTVISPRNHMVFTPLLASTTVGTLDFRSVTVSLRNIQPALGEGSNMYYKAKALEIKDGAVLCDSKGTKFEVPFDELAICTGAQGSTFGIPGVIEHALPLRDVSDAEKIRSKIIKNVLECQIPGVPEDKKRRMLNFVIVGGGPTGVEFAGELSNLVKEDLMKAMPKVSCTVRITLIEARDILGSFNPDLRLYAEKILSKSGVEIVKAQVKAVNETSVVLSDGSEIDYGLLVWSTGVGPTPFITSLPFAKARDGRLEVDEYLRVKDEEGKVVENIYSLGDCSCISTNPLPTTAQVAEQQGKWLSFYLNGRRNIENDMEDGATTTGPFEYKQLGQMSAMTTGSAVMDLGGGPKSNTPQVSLSGFFSWIGWRAVYLTKLGAFENRIYVLLNWVTTQILGRDLSRW